MVRSRVHRFVSVVVVGGAAAGLAVAQAPPLAAGPEASAPAALVTGAVFSSTPVERVLDTRTGKGGLTRLAGGTFYDFAVPGCPAGATAAALNVTTDAAAGGFVAAYAGGTRTVTTSLLNPNPGGVRANFALVPLSTSGQITLFAQRATDLVIDRFGCMVTAPSTGATEGRFVPPTPAQRSAPRIFDSRGPDGSGPRRPGGSVLRLPVPDGFVRQAVALNLTVTDADRPGWLGVAPGGQFDWANPTSNVNFLAGEARANNVIVPVAADGTIDIAVSTDVHVIVDFAGGFTNVAAPATLEGVFVPKVDRLLDTRPSRPLGRLAVNEEAVATASGFVSAPLALFVNVTADDAAGPGYLAAYSGRRPLLSTVNFDRGETSPNGAIVPLDPGASGVTVVPGVSATAALVDLAGYWVDLSTPGRTANGALRVSAYWDADRDLILDEAERLLPTRPTVTLRPAGTPLASGTLVPYNWAGWLAPGTYELYASYPSANTFGGTAVVTSGAVTNALVLVAPSAELTADQIADQVFAELSFVRQTSGYSYLPRTTTDAVRICATSVANGLSTGCPAGTVVSSFVVPDGPARPTTYPSPKEAVASWWSSEQDRLRLSAPGSQYDVACAWRFPVSGDGFACAARVVG